ncbi:MAG: flagellar hook-associated protein FlgK [Bacteroidetes bacterium]|nr:flagellar hook-associated protein FlgK [Bacteroidota bacterium]
MLSRIFNISSRSLDVYRKALDVTAHNIANAGNKDYSRQVLNISTAFPDKMAGFIWGAGINMDTIQRVRNNFIENQLRVSTQESSFFDKQSILLGRVEQIFTEPTEFGLSESITSFFNSWGELAVAPNSYALRENVIAKAENMSTRVETIHRNLETTKKEVFDEFKNKIDTLNGLLSNINELNVKIAQQVHAGFQPNDLLDSRDAMIDEVTTIVDAQVFFDSNGSANISIGGILAVDLVQSIEFKITASNGKLNLTTLQNHDLQQIKGGELGALSDVYSNKIPDYLEQVDNIINVLFNSVNQVHSTGYTINDPPVTGIDFFSNYSNGVLRVNNEILDDPNKIAVSADGTSGNGDIAVQIADINNQPLLNGNTIVESYSSLISKVGNEKATSDSLSASTELVLQQLKQQRASYSGVSLDEEMANIIRFQRSYEASAKLISVADEMLQTLLNMV